jgi:hypothetical protein
MDHWLLIFAAVCFVVEALWHKSVLAAGLFFWVFSLIV